MGLLDDIMAQDAVHMVDADGFGESVTYTTRANVANTYDAVIDRRGVEPTDGNPDGVSEVFVVSLVYDANGVNGPSACEAGDRVSFPPRIGEAVRTKRVMRVMETDYGMWVLECR